MIPILTGLAAGGLHVFSGADHMAALAPIAVEDPSTAGRTGAFWGLGHGLGVVVVGALGLFLRSFVDIDAWSKWAEFTVGLLLLGVGVWALRRASRIEIHSHPHEHEETAHQHIHAHQPSSRRHDHAALGVGVLHGIAGSGHLFGVIPALALPIGQAVVYLAAFLAAAIVAMSAFAYVLGLVAEKGGANAIRNLMYGSGALALLVGLVWIVNSWPG